MSDDASALLDSIDPSKGSASFEGAAAPRAPQASPQDQADSMLDSIDPRVSGWGAPKGTEPENGSTAVGAFSRAAERSALPTAGGLAGAAGGASAGAEIGALGGPVGAIAGGLIGGIGGSMLGAGAVDAAQNWALSKLPTGAQKFLGGTEDQQKEDFEGHPFASILGGVAPYLLTANPGIAARETAEGATGLAKIMGNKYTAAALSGLTMGGITLGQEVVQGQKPDWTEVGINTLLGTVWSKPNALGERIMGGAEAAGARIGQRITGRAPTPETVTIADGGDQKVGPGPGLTEDVATGQAEMAPPAEAQARAAARDEQTLTEPPKVMNPVETARRIAPTLFDGYEALEHQRDTFRAMADDADELGDIDASKAAKEHLAKTEEKMDDIVPDIRDEISRVAESRGSEAVEPQGDTEPVAELASPEMKQFISDDVSRQLHAAGRSEEEARAAGDLIAARYATRASVMNGAIGTAKDLYRREGAVIRGGDGTARRIAPAPAEPSSTPTAAAPAVAEPPGADVIAAAQDRAQKLGLTNLIRQMHGQDIPPEQIAEFVGNKMSAEQIDAFLSSPEPARATRARAKIEEKAPEIAMRKPQRQKQSGPPQTLRAFLKSKGGIRDMFGELRTMGMVKEYPGLVNNKAGHPLDYARTLAAEAGYLGHDTSVADFLDAIKKHPLYTREGQVWHDRQVERNGNEGEDSREAHANERIESFWAEHGEGKIDAELKDRASQIITQRDVTPDEAIEIASVELYHEDGEREHAAGIQADLQGNKGSLEPGERPGEAGTSVGSQEAVRGGSEGFEDVDFSQGAQGKIRFKPNDLRPTITLFRDADASTFLHETGHDFLEQMRRDATHDAAPQALKDDIAAVRQWVGNKGGEFKTREHEKFARGFEQYMREGTAPTAGLARVFQQFKSWLTQIYRSIKGLGDPISPEIRRVFDRMLTEPERPAIVAPGRQPGTSIADVHEADALSTPAEHAHAAADRIVAEKEQAKAELPPEIQAEHATGQAEIEAERARAAGIEPTAEDGDGAAGGGNVPDASGTAGNEPSSGGGRPQSSAKQSSGGGSISEGNGPGAGSKPSGTGVGDSLLPRPVTRFPEPESGLVDKAGNVRLDNLVLPEQLGEVLMESADRNADFKSVRGSMTKGEMMDLASDLGMRPDEEGLEANLAKITGKFDNLAKYALALRLLVRQSSQAVYEAATISAREGTDEATVSLAKAIARHDMIQSTLSGATANWGRSGSAFHNLNSFKGATDLDKVLRDNVGRTLFQVKLIGRMIAGADATPAQVSAIVRDSGKYSFGEMILEYWVNGLISGPITHTTYTVGNALIAANKIFLETPAASALSALRGREDSNVIPFGEAAAQLRGAANGVVPAIHAAAEGLRTGITTALPGEKTVQTYGPIQAAGLPGAVGGRLQENAGMSDVLQSFYGMGRGLKDAFIVSGAIDKAKTPAIGFEYSPRGVIPNVVLGGRARLPVGEAARLPGRFISAIHSFFRAMGYSAEINGQEYRQAYNEGARGDALPQRIADLRLDRQAAQMQGATEGEAFDRMAVARFEANEQTLMGPAGKITQMLSRFTNTAYSVPGLGETRIFKFIDPFVNISGQIMNQALMRRTPLGFLAPTIRADLMGTNGPVAADRALARMMVGSSLAVTAGVLAAEGYLSGAGPQDPKQMATWRLAGNQPHSVKMNDTWYDLHRIGPLGMLLGMAADLYDVAHTATHDDLQSAVGQLMHAIAQNVLDESFMRGPAEFLKAIDDKSYAENQYIPNFVSSFVPYSVGSAQVARTMDPYMRLTHGIIDAIKAKVPGYSQELQPRRNLWGQPIPNHEGLGGLTAIWEQKQSTDPVNLEMQRLGIGKPMPGRSLSNIKLTDQQYDDYARIAGVMTKQRMDQYVRSGLYQHQTDGDRREGIDAIFKGCREAARGMMFMKNPDIPARATALRKLRATGADIRAIGE